MWLAAHEKTSRDRKWAIERIFTDKTVWCIAIYGLWDVALKNRISVVIPYLLDGPAQAGRWSFKSFGRGSPGHVFYVYQRITQDNYALEWFWKAASAPIRSAVKFYVDLYIRIFFQLFQKIFFRSIQKFPKLFFGFFGFETGFPSSLTSHHYRKPMKIQRKSSKILKNPNFQKKYAATLKSLREANTLFPNSFWIVITRFLGRIIHINFWGGFGLRPR